MPLPRQEGELSCIYVLGYRYCLFLRIVYWSLELFAKCGIFLFFILFNSWHTV
jgi:hypothetical protein